MDSLLRRVENELSTLGDVALETAVASLEELLLVVIGLADDVNGLLGTRGLSSVSLVLFGLADSTYAKLDGDGEEVDAGGLCDGLAASNTGEIDEAGLNDALLSLQGADDLVGEA